MLRKKKYQVKNDPLAKILIQSSFSVQLYSLEQIINFVLQTENILQKNLRNHFPLTLKKNDVVKTGGIDSLINLLCEKFTR